MANVDQTLGQRRLVTVLERMIQLIEDDEDNVDMFDEALDNMLDEIHGNDGFGTEGQTDPRGDFRDGEFSVWNVQGIDD